MSLNPCACYVIPMYFWTDVGCYDNSLQVWFNDIFELMKMRAAVVVSDKNKLMHNNESVPVKETVYLFIINFNAFMMYFHLYRGLVSNGHNVVLWTVFEGDALLCEHYQGPNLHDLAYYVREMDQISIRPVSTYCADILRSRGFRVEATLPNMVSMDKFDLHHIPNYNRAPFIFLCVCANTERKNIPMLLRAFEAEFGADEGVLLHIRTSNLDNATLPKHITVLPKLVSMRELYKTAHAFVLPSEVEGFGMPVLEALLNGLPVVVPFHSGLNEFVHNGNALPVQHRLKRNHYHSETNIFGNVYEVDEIDLRRQMRRMVSLAPQLSKSIDRKDLANRFANPDVFMQSSQG